MIDWLKRWVALVAPSAPPARVGVLDDADAWGHGPLTWVTNCCRQDREDAQVSVLKVPITGHLEAFPGFAMNYRYCNDRSLCIRAAQEARVRGGRP